MVVNLNRVSHVTVSGFRVELHFMDGSSHMKRFLSVDDMVSTMQQWKEETDVLTGVERPSSLRGVCSKRS
jgi:hypothetical protein